VAAQASSVGFIRRKLADGDIYFIANTSNREVRTTATVSARRAHAAWWNPHDGAVTPTAVQPALPLVLAPYESRVLVLSDSAGADAPDAQGAPRVATLADLGGGWELSFPGAGGALAQPRKLASLTSWPDDAATRYYSGIGSYTREITLDAAQLKGARIKLDFGAGTPLATTPKVPAGMRAMLDSPIREAAVVYVNGQRAGAVWHPPYQVDISAQLRPGANRIEVQVANLSLNQLAGQERPDYRLLSARYGQRFVPQDTQLISPRPSGMLGQVRLLSETTP
jgi:hypothetical protein